MKSTLTFIIGLLLASGVSATELPADQQPQVARLPDDPRIFRTTLRKGGDDGVHTYRIPGLATTPQGTLIAVFDARNKNGADLPGDIDVAMMRSTDAGATWSPMRRIIDFDANVPNSRGNGVGDPAVLVDQRTGTIFVVALWSKGPRAWFGSGPGLTPDETGQLVIVNSTDDGLTWSAPVSITPQIKNPSWLLCFNGPGSGIQLTDGTLVFPAQFKEAEGAAGAKHLTQAVAHSCFVASRDGGKTWTIAPAAIPNGVPTSESAIAQLADGSLLLSMRNESRAGVRAWSRWEWHGDLWQGKWSKPWFTVPDPTCMASLIRHPHGELILSNPNHPQHRVALTIRASTDDGRTWSAGRLLDPGVAMYSCLTVLRDGRIGVLYESGDAAGLVFARFPLEWLLTLPTGLASAAPAADLVRELKPLSVRGVNYFPRETPWSAMWSKTPPAVFEKDMALAASLGCNTIRTFLQFSAPLEQAGLLGPDGSLTPAYHEKIEQLLAAAWRHGIRVVVCFEFSPQWLAAPDAGTRWQRALGDVVGKHRDDGRVLMWDMMNEPDDDAKWTPATRAYLKAALPLIKQLDPNHLTTVGLTWRADRLNEIGLPDVMQYHEYAGKDVFFKEGPPRVLVTFGNQRKIGGTRPLLIGEFGMSTARDEQHGAAPELRARMSAATGTEAEQARLYEIVLAGAEQGRAAGALAWCLHDYPITNPNESHFGLVRGDGSLKPAARVLRETFTRWSKP